MRSMSIGRSEGEYRCGDETDAGEYEGDEGAIEFVVTDIIQALRK